MTRARHQPEYLADQVPCDFALAFTDHIQTPGFNRLENDVHDWIADIDRAIERHVR